MKIHGVDIREEVTSVLYQDMWIMKAEVRGCKVEVVDRDRFKAYHRIARKIRRFQSLPDVESILRPSK